MSNLDATQAHSTCVQAADAASDELLLLFAFALYSVGGFNLGIFLQQLNIFMILFMQQYEDCGVNELLIQWDTIMSKTADATSMGMNLLIMLTASIWTSCVSSTRWRGIVSSVTWSK